MNRHEQGCTDLEDAGSQTPLPLGVPRTWRQRISTWLPVRPARVRRLHLVETLTIGQRGSLVLVECHGQPLLVGTGKEGVTSITILPRERSTGGAQ